MITNRRLEPPVLRPRRGGGVRAAVVAGSLAVLAALAPPAFAQADVGGAGAAYDVRAARLISEGELVGRLARERFRLLGEVHDNALHHEIRARLIAGIAATGARPAVALEVFDLDHEKALRAAQRDGRPDAERLAHAGGLDRASWRWPLHKPVLAAALDAGLPVRAANLSREALQQAIRGGGDPATGSPWAARLAAAPWTAAQESALEASIVDGHCGKLPGGIVERIARAQRERDAAMAQALVDAATRDGAILIAGNGHVRSDIGVPAYLPEGPHVSVGFIETSAEDDTSTEQGRRALAGDNPGFDYLWFTSKAERADPCEQMPGSAAR